TYIEHRGSIQGKRVVWVGDGNNMCQSYMNAADMLDFQLIIACPEGFEPCSDLLQKFNDRVSIVRDPVTAITKADLVVTDTWASMGQEEEKQQREKAFAGFQVNEEVMSLAADDALFMHCLPAYRGMEISETIMESKWSVVWDEAENRLHAQKALVEFLLNHMAI
ncbi:MAG: ornithine carbamoyltransferase, partial [Porticoccus sp.]|nr:ornithine carbamoyltransferase [Porticoccus sp.]